MHKSALATILLAAGLLSACGDRENAAPTSSTTAASPGAFLGECGGATDDDVRRITGFTTVVPVARNGIKCVWESPGVDRQIMFTWFRGSPIDRERTIATVKGKQVDDFEVSGWHGFTANAHDLCQVAVGDGADFFHWMVYGPDIAACDMLRPLAQLTVDRSAR